MALRKLQLFPTHNAQFGKVIGPLRLSSQSRVPRHHAVLAVQYSRQRHSRGQLDQYLEKFRIPPTCDRSGTRQQRQRLHQKSQFIYSIACMGVTRIEEEQE